MGAGRQEAGRKWREKWEREDRRREERGGKKEAGRGGRRKDRGEKRGPADRQRREEGPTERQRWEEGAGARKTEPPPSNLAMYLNFQLSPVL